MISFCVGFGCQQPAICLLSPRPTKECIWPELDAFHTDKRFMTQSLFLFFFVQSNSVLEWFKKKKKINTIFLKSPQETIVFRSLQHFQSNVKFIREDRQTDGRTDGRRPTRAPDSFSSREWWSPQMGECRVEEQTGFEAVQKDEKLIGCLSAACSKWENKLQGCERSNVARVHVWLPLQCSLP